MHKVLFICETTSSEVTYTACTLHRCNLLHTAFSVLDQLLSPVHLLLDTFRWVGGQGGVIQMHLQTNSEASYSFNRLTLCNIVAEKFTGKSPNLILE